MTVKYKYKLLESNQFAVEILEGELEGFTYQYDSVKINEDEDEIGLDYNILDVTGEEVDCDVLELDLFSESSEEILGDILVDIIETKLKEMNNNGWLSDPVCYNMYLIDRVERVNYADNVQRILCSRWCI